MQFLVYENHKKVLLFELGNSFFIIISYYCFNYPQIHIIKNIIKCKKYRLSIKIKIVNNKRNKIQLLMYSSENRKNPKNYEY